MANTEMYEDSKIWNAHIDIAKRIDSYFHPEEKKKKSLVDKILNRKN